MLLDARPDVPSGPSDAVLVAYASKHGTAKRIAERVGAVLDAATVRAEVVDVEAAPGTGVEAYGRVVLVAAIHGDHHHAAAVAWLQRQRPALAGRELAIVSASLTAATGAAGEEKTARYVDALEAETGVAAHHALRVAGSLRYPAYNAATRLLMRGIAAAKGLATDTGRDHDYTDWTAVDAFARALAGRVVVAAERPAALAV
ncbi:flavodoxin domain-containing protein [Patulibacter sp. S7RM1-6]